MVKRYYLGLDLGGTHIKVGVGSEGELAWSEKIASGAAGGRDAVLRALIEGANAGLAWASERGFEVSGVGVVSPGVIDRGRVISAPSNLPDWNDVDLAALFESQLQRRVAVDNDANAAVLAEARFGVAQGSRSVLMATVGTGIGGGAVVDGSLIRGTHGAGMELGHITLHPGVDARPCNCGLKGCLEAYAGGWAMHRSWIQALSLSAIEEWDGKTLSELELRDLVRAAVQGEQHARVVVEGGSRALGVGLASAMHLLDPDCVVLGGGILDGFPELQQRVETELRQRLMPRLEATLRVERARFGNEAGVLGALALAEETLP